MRADQAIATTLRLCRRGLAAPVLTPELLAAIGAAVPHDRMCWGLLDPVTQLPTTNLNASPAAGPIGRIWEFELTVPDVITLAELRATRSHVGVLSIATNGRPERSARHRSLLAPHFGVTDELRAVLVVDGVGWGWMSLMRDGGEPFTIGDSDRVARLVPALAGALRAAALSASIADEPDVRSPGVVILDAGGRIDSITPSGRMLLDLIPTPAGMPVPGVLHSLAYGEGSRQARIPGRDGNWLYVEAEPLSGSGGRVAVTLQVAGRTEMSPVILRAHGLTGRECDVVLCVLRGESNRQIASRLHLSPWTVQDHLKSVFAKVDVRSRRDLAMRLFEAPMSASR